MNDNDLIDLGSITIDLNNCDYDYVASDIIYTSGSSDTITLGDYTSTSGSSNTITLDTFKSSTGEYNFDWFEDQRIVNEYNEEKEIRERNEGVQAAWEQYKIMVELAKLPPENLDNLE